MAWAKQTLLKRTLTYRLTIFALHKHMPLMCFGKCG